VVGQKANCDYCFVVCCAAVCLVTSTAYASKKTSRIGGFSKTNQQTPNRVSTPAAAVAPWLVNCATTKGQVACQVSQRLTIRKTGQPLFAVTVRIPPKSKNAAMMMQLPHGVFLPAGLSLKVDGSKAKKTIVEQKKPIQTCDRNGCYVGMPITEATLKALKSGTTMVVSFQNLAKKDIRLSISLNGFEEAYNKLS